MSKQSTLTPELRAKYARQFDTAKIKPEQLPEVHSLVKRIVAGMNIYKQIEFATGVPAWMIGVIHARESTCNFKKHLHNGDSLQRRTVLVPKGRPVQGNPPFTFVESATDALEFDGLTSIKDTRIANALFVLENFNGAGYRGKGIPSPYIWSKTDQYTSGKYVGDHDFDPDAVDGQVGVAALLIRLYELGEVSIQGEPIAVKVVGKDTDILGYILRGNTWVAARAFAESCGATVAVSSLDPVQIKVHRGEKEMLFAGHLFEGKAFVDASDLAGFLGRSLGYDPASRTLTVF